MSVLVVAAPFRVVTAAPVVATRMLPVPAPPPVVVVGVVGVVEGLVVVGVTTVVGGTEGEGEGEEPGG